MRSNCDGCGKNVKGGTCVYLTGEMTTFKENNTKKRKRVKYTYCLKCFKEQNRE